MHLFYNKTTEKIFFELKTRREKYYEHYNICFMNQVPTNNIPDDDNGVGDTNLYKNFCAKVCNFFPIYIWMLFI